MSRVRPDAVIGVDNYAKLKVSTVFAAISIEAAVNNFILMHCLFLQQPYLQEVFGTIATKFLRSSIHDKIKVLRQNWPDEFPDDLMHDVREPFRIRNQVTHLSDEFVTKARSSDGKKCVRKPLKHHGLIQAFSRTNRVLNATKPYGNILDFRQQQDAVDAAIALFSGEKTGEQAREIWLVEKAPVVIQKLEAAVQKLDAFMKSQGLDCAPSAVANLKGDAAKTVFIERFKEVQRLKTQLDQYTDLTEENKTAIAQVLPEDSLRGFIRCRRIF